VVFWSLLWVSIVSSAAFVFFDEGRRVLASSFPLVFLFFAMGMTAPHSVVTRRHRADVKIVRFGMAMLIAALFLFLSTPWLAYRVSPARNLIVRGIPQTSEQIVVFGGRRLVGFLVLPDEIPLRKEISSIHLREFEAIIKQSNIEMYQGLLHPEMPNLPFGFVFAARLEEGTESDRLFIVPPEVMERREVPAWRFHVKVWQPESVLPGHVDHWLYVTGAEPLH
jgi:hypothetical protein